MKTLTTAAACAALLLTACDKDEASAPPGSRVAAAEFVAASAAFSGAYLNADARARQQPGLQGLRAPGDDEAEVVLDRESAFERALTSRDCGAVDFASTPNTFFPATLTIDFGEGCDAYGQRVGGRLVAVYSASPLTEGATVAIAFDDYRVGEATLSGDYLLTNTGKDARGRFTSRHTITDGRVAYDDGTAIAYDETVESVLAEGGDTDFWTAGLAGVTDDVWEDTRTAQLTTRAGNDFAVTTTKALRRPATCTYVTAGTYGLASVSIGLTGTLDFGDGACDDDAEVRVGGEAWGVKL